MKKNSVFRASLLVLSLGLPGFADGNYILKLWNASSVGNVCNNHGVHVVTAMTGSATGIFVVGVPSGPLSSSIVQSLATDPNVSVVEPDTQVALPELAGEPVRPAGQSALPPLYNPNQNTLYYGTMVWDPYVNQPATWTLGVSFAHWFSTGQGTVVALIDTGVNPNNLVLQPVLTGGYDFTRNVAGGSEMADVAQSTTEVLDQSTTEVLDYTQAVVLTLNQSTTEVLDQSTEASVSQLNEYST